MNALLLDTHVVIWLATDDPKLGPKSKKIITRAVLAGRGYISALSFWEIAMLVLQDAIEIDLDLGQWRQTILATGLRELPLTGDAAIRGAQAMPYHDDPCDRMMVGSALAVAADLMSADAKLLSWRGALARHNARK